MRKPLEAEQLHPQFDKYMNQMLEFVRCEVCTHGALVPIHGCSGSTAPSAPFNTSHPAVPRLAGVGPLSSSKLVRLRKLNLARHR